MSSSTGQTLSFREERIAHLFIDGLHIAVLVEHTGLPIRSDVSLLLAVPGVSDDAGQGVVGRLGIDVVECDFRISRPISCSCIAGAIRVVPIESQTILDVASCDVSTIAM